MGWPDLGMFSENVESFFVCFEIHGILFFPKLLAQCWFLSGTWEMADHVYRSSTHLSIFLKNPVTESDYQNSWRGCSWQCVSHWQLIVGEVIVFVNYTHTASSAKRIQVWPAPPHPSFSPLSAPQLTRLWLLTENWPFYFFFKFILVDFFNLERIFGQTFSFLLSLMFENYFALIKLHLYIYMKYFKIYIYIFFFNLIQNIYFLNIVIHGI